MYRFISERFFQSPRIQLEPWFCRYRSCADTVRRGSILVTGEIDDIELNTRTLLCALGLVSAAGLSACDESRGERVLSGGAIGAGVGVLGGLLLGSPAAGAVLGGAAGAATGAVTDKDDIDLGKPVWN